MTTNLPSNIQTALSERGIDHAVWSTLQNSIFPGAKDESILLAIDYCKARKMDILKKPCHIVPMSVTDAKTGEKNGVM
ncbi:recombinase RecT [Glaesserella parasuis]|uniref:recombinase RecT n=1 Tax=Glaesserella parasuis TaxID=738 RepID=UPI0023675844|nr:recombinase RecT [Glaesserella parasuis]MDG6366619.1 recombinase RecT [Glaesserella parasuis]MDG6444918.1 recombinase RecT [Glaesserella parasuis]WDI28601.1 recombinase RecT [Glaesserella parasuis]